MRHCQHGSFFFNILEKFTCNDNYGHKRFPQELTNATYCVELLIGRSSRLIIVTDLYFFVCDIHYIRTVSV